MHQSLATAAVCRSRLLAAALCAAMSGVTIWGCTQPSAPEPQAGITDVAMQNLAFVPKEITIHVGESVRWTNLESGPFPHTATSGNPGDADAGILWDSDTLSQGESFTRQFNEPGEFVYFCTHHPTVPAMRDAKVIVVAE